MNLKLLYLDAKPVKSFEFQIGGIAVNQGENTEATGYDNDVYITGERVLIRRPKKLYFDKISLTTQIWATSLTRASSAASTISPSRIITSSSSANR